MKEVIHNRLRKARPTFQKGETMVGERVNSRGYRRTADGHEAQRVRVEHQINSLVHECAEEICQYAARCVADTDCGPDPLEVCHIIWRYLRGDE